jgi:FtsP/CotA-like multicopper oxidase with cupredoxin domain
MASIQPPRRLANNTESPAPALVANASVENATASGIKRISPSFMAQLSQTPRRSERSGFNRWTINDVAFAEDRMQPMFRVQQGKGYRLRMRNASDDIHPIHLHRHSFELTRVAGQAVSGVVKDVVMLGGYQEMEVDFVADNPGMTLFHCHQQVHMDFGFMALFEYV